MSEPEIQKPVRTKFNAPKQSEKLASLRQEILDEIDDFLGDAQKEAVNSRASMNRALAMAYAWYARASGLSNKQTVNQAYLEHRFRNHKPPITKKEGVSDFNRVVKLIFNMTPPQYASTVSRYTMALEYLDRHMSTPEHEEHRQEVDYVVGMISEAGSIEDCVKKQRTWLSEQGESERKADKKIAAHIEKESQKAYKAKPKLGDVKAQALPTQDGFVLLMGRANGAGRIEIIDVLESDAKDVERLVAKHALRDTSGISETVNLLGESFDLASVIPGKPVVAVEKDGKWLMISQGKDHDASVVVTTRPKNGAFAGFSERASLSAKGREWLAKNIVDAPRRRLFECDFEDGGSSVTDLVLTNQVTEEKKPLHFNKITETSKNQVVRDATAMNAWQFEFDLDMAMAVHIYGEWLKPWIGVEKSKKEERIIVMTVSKDGVSFAAESSQEVTYAVDTGITDEETYTLKLFGSDLVGVFSALVRRINGVECIHVRGHDTGILELEAENDLANYVVDLPTALADLTNHNTRHFDKLR